MRCVGGRGQSQQLPHYCLYYVPNITLGRQERREEGGRNPALLVSHCQVSLPELLT